MPHERRVPQGMLWLIHRAIPELRDMPEHLRHCQATLLWKGEWTFPSWNRWPTSQDPSMARQYFSGQAGAGRSRLPSEQERYMALEHAIHAWLASIHAWRIHAKGEPSWSPEELTRWKRGLERFPRALLRISYEAWALCWRIREGMRVFLRWLGLKYRSASIDIGGHMS